MSLASRASTELVSRPFASSPVGPDRLAHPKPPRPNPRPYPGPNPSHVASRLASVLTLASSIGAAGLISAVANAQSYTYHELASLPGFANASVNGINNLGQAVGSVQDPGTAERLAVIWDAYAPMLPPTSLGVPPHSWGFPDVGAVAINDLGEVVGAGKGVAPSGTVPFHVPYRWSPSTGFVQLKPVATGNWNTWQYGPRSINCHGNVVGAGTLAGTYANGKIGMHWTPASVTPVIQSPPGGIQLYNFVALEPFGGNDLDQVVGTFVPSFYTPSWFSDQGHAFFWESNGGYTTLSAGAFSGEARDINNCEQIVGVVRFSAQGTPQPYLWQRSSDGTFSSMALPGLSPDPAHHAYPLALNDSGQAIGRAQVGTTLFAPVVWNLVNASITDLRPFLPAPDPTAYWTQMEVRDIGNDGLIVGTISTLLTPISSTTLKAFVLVPSIAPTILCSGACPPNPPTFDLLPPTVGYQDAIRHRVTFTVVGGTPGQTVLIADDTGGRYRQAIATQCPFMLPPASILIGSGIFGNNGVATITESFSNAFSGSTREYIAVDPGACIYDAEFFVHP